MPLFSADQAPLGRLTYVLLGIIGFLVVFPLPLALVYQGLISPKDLGLAFIATVALLRIFARSVPLTRAAKANIVVIVISFTLATVLSVFVPNKTVVACFAEQPPSFETVVIACSQLIEESSANKQLLALAYLHRGIAYGEHDEKKRALEDLTKGIDTDPTNGGAFLARGAMELSLHKPLDAKKDSEQAAAHPIKQAQFAMLSLILRGSTKLALGDTAGALADTNAAIISAPTAALGYAARSGMLFSEGEIKRAIEDEDRALAIDARDPDFFSGRGFYELLSNNPDSAATDLVQAATLGDTEKMAGVWLHLARRGENKPDSDELFGNAAKVSSSKWPRPLYSFFQGAIDEEGLKTAAKDPDELTQRGQLCEANYYLGEAARLNGETNKAKAFFETARDTCFADYLEFAAAKIRLAPVESGQTPDK